MLRILKQLGINPVNDAINTKEAASVLTWRAKEELDTDFTYTETAVRKRVHSGSLIPVGGKNSKSRYNTYKMEDVFALPLFPTRGSGQRHTTTEEQDEEMAA
jgi:hypothetical protein